MSSGGGPADPPPTLYTVGHSTRSGDELVELLRGRGIELLVDVRRYPASRRHPWFDREALEARLGTEGIAYRHREVLGGRRSLAGDSPNTAWRSEGFRAYADHANTDAFREALAAVLEAAAERPAAVMCAEIVPWRCHRRIIADHAVARGWRIVHLIDGERTDEHELNENARVLDDGRIVYPAPEDDQGELFR